MKAILVVAAMALLSLLGYFADAAWVGLDGKADKGVEALRKVELVEKDVSHIKAGQLEIKEGQKTILEAVHDLEHN